jgi:hypothetical protein
LQEKSETKDKEDNMSNYTAELINQPEKKLVVVNLEELLLREIPPREEILSPWLFSHSSNMIFAKRGVGKTHVALGIACAVASGGSFLKWTAPKPRKVLYIDGEMPAVVIQERLAKLSSNIQFSSYHTHLNIITPDLQEVPMPNLGTQVGQDIINEHIFNDTELIIIDNLSSLMRSGKKENEAESWDDFERWILMQRARGKCILIIHHAGKNGEQRGTSKREDLMDTVIQLKWPDGYKANDGACFEVHFEKARSIYGPETAPFMVRLIDNNTNQRWCVEKLKSSDAQFQEILLLQDSGFNQTQIAQQLGVNKSTVSRALKNNVSNFVS